MKTCYRRDDSPGRGRHLVATAQIQKGQLIFVEKPLLSLQTLGNAHSGALVCRHCRAFVGGPTVCLEVASGYLNRDQVGKTVIQGPSTFNNGFLDSCPYLVPCRHVCGEIFCSNECESAMWDYGGHELLCTGWIPDPPDVQDAHDASSSGITQGLVRRDGTEEGPNNILDGDENDTLHPLLKFKVHAVRNNEIFLMVGDLVATVVSLYRKQLEVCHGSCDKTVSRQQHLTLSEILAPYLDFTLNPWWEVATKSMIASPLGFVEANQLDKTLRTLCKESSELIKEALLELTKDSSPSSVEHPHTGQDGETFRHTLLQAISDCDELLTDLFFGKIIGSFEQNAIGIRARHPLCRDILESASLREKCHLQIVACLKHGGLLEEEEDPEGSDNEDDGDQMDTETVLEEQTYTLEQVDHVIASLYIEEEGCGLHANKAKIAIDDENAMDESEGDDLDILFSPLDGTAMYQMACKMNHSCDPNVIVRYTYSKIPGGPIGINRWGQNYPLVLECVARRDIEENEELCISYINNAGDVHERQDALFCTYGFQCTCKRCNCELKSISFTSDLSGQSQSFDLQIFGEDENMTEADIVSEVEWQSGEKMYPILQKLNERWERNAFGSLPVPVFSTVVTFIVRNGSELIHKVMTGDEVDDNLICHQISSRIQSCMDALAVRNFGLCIELGTRGEADELCWLLSNGGWRCTSSQSAYMIYALTAAVAFAQRLNFTMAMALLDKAFVVGLPRTALEPFFEYVSNHSSSIFRSHARLSHLHIISSIETSAERPDFSSLNIKYPILEVGHVTLFQNGTLDEAIRNRKPLIIRNFGALWPAVAKWKRFTIFVSDHGHRIIPIEVGDMISGMKESFITFSSFYHHFLRSGEGSNQKDHPSIAYLAQHSLCDQIPELLQDLCLPSNVASLTEGETKINVWIGTKGTRTPLHYDSMNNIFVQIYGYKYVRLYGVEETDKLYVLTNRTYGKQGNMSAVDCEREDFTKYPLAANARYEEAVLSPGDALFIPSFEWHYVRGLTESTSVNLWF